MKAQVYNPYLPLDIYIPDGEPHVFGDRIYIFGSHDKENGDTYCMLDYEVFSAPVDDLTAWRSEGIIYWADQDPARDEKNKYMYAPDVVRGNDGRYYLYYAMAGGHFTGPIHVAVCDEPAGKYEYYGEVKNPDGSTFDRNITFDPGVINDNGKIYLYYGWGLGIKPIPKVMNGIVKWLSKEIVSPMLYGKTKEQIKREPYGIEGANVVELSEDMLTVKGEPERLIPGQLDANGTEWEGHAFCEASSMRKIGDTYYFIYSSQVYHELCYATSVFPNKGFKYGGVIVSNGDIGYKGKCIEEKIALTGNNHGSIECINGQWYIFYHRQTNKTCYSRQGCAEKIEILPDGSIPQIEITSCGLNDGALIAKGSYPAAICCNLYNTNIRKYGHAPIRKHPERMPYICCKNNERYIDEICDDTVIGYKYFRFEGRTVLLLSYKGEGAFLVKNDEKVLGEVKLQPAEEWCTAELEFELTGTHALYLEYTGTGMCSLKEIGFK